MINGFKSFFTSAILRSMLRVSWSGVSAGFTRMLSSSALPSMDCYRTLGVSRTASDADIKKRYLELVKQYHPDKNGSHDDFVKIQSAYEVLSKRRNDYDQKDGKNVNETRQSGTADNGWHSWSTQAPWWADDFSWAYRYNPYSKKWKTATNDKFGFREVRLFWVHRWQHLLFPPERGWIVSNFQRRASQGCPRGIGLLIKKDEGLSLSGL